MTLKARNRYIFSYAVLATLLTAGIFILFAYNTFFKGNTSDSSYIFQLDHFSFFSGCSEAVITGIFLMALYLPVSGFFLHAHFEKTPSTEISFFLLFLAGSIPEYFRILIPLFHYAGTYSQMLIFIGKSLFWGRTVSLLSLLLVGIYGDPEHRVRIEQIILISTALIMFLAMQLPVNNSVITKAFTIPCGYSKIIYGFYGITSVLTVLIFILKGKENENPGYYTIGIYSIVIIIAKHIASVSDVFFMILAGMILLCFATFRYLEAIHEMYI